MHFPASLFPLAPLALSLGYGSGGWQTTADGSPASPELLAQLGGFSFYVPENRYGVQETLPSACKVDQVNLLMRHDFRGPSTGVGASLDAVADKLADTEASHFETNGRHQELAFLADFGKQYISTTPELLQSWGVRQATSAGSQFGNAYHALLGEHDWYGNWTQGAGEVFVRTTDQSRVNVTSRAFMTGLLGQDWEQRSTLLVLPDSESGFNTSIAVGNCPYSKQDQSSSEAFGAWNAKYLPAVVRRLQKALPRLNLTTTDVQAMQSMCPFQTAFYGHLSPFCSVFSLEEWKKYSYGQDLQSYANGGYGGPLGRAWSVGWVNELLARLTDSPVVDHTTTNTTLNADPSSFPLGLPMYLDFTHDTQLLSAIAIIGLLRDTPGLSKTGPVKDSRKWKYSSISPMGGRLTVERLQCAKTESLRASTYVRLILNGAVLPLTELAECSLEKQGKQAAAHGLCPLADFVESQEFARKGGDYSNCFQ